MRRCLAAAGGFSTARGYVAPFDLHPSWLHQLHTDHDSPAPHTTSCSALLRHSLTPGFTLHPCIRSIILLEFLICKGAPVRPFFSGGFTTYSTRRSDWMSAICGHTTTKSVSRWRSHCSSGGVESRWWCWLFLWGVSLCLSDPAAWLRPFLLLSFPLFLFSSSPLLSGPDLLWLDRTLRTLGHSEGGSLGPASSLQGGKHL